jgi:hypothetical protein
MRGEEGRGYREIRERKRDRAGQRRRGAVAVDRLSGEVLATSAETIPLKWRVLST